MIGDVHESEGDVLVRNVPNPIERAVKSLCDKPYGYVVYGLCARNHVFGDDSSRSRLCSSIPKHDSRI